MALVLGTNYGFVTSSPVDDPAAGNTTADTRSLAVIDTSPATAAKITEIGWWANADPQDTNFEVGLYSDEGNGEPEARLYVDATNATGGSAGWKRVSVDWEISPSTNYWLAIQVDDVGIPSTTVDYASSGGPGIARLYSQTTLLSDWGTSTAKDSDGIICIYAVWEAGPGPEGTNLQINIEDTWKEVSAIKVNVGDSWKDVESAKINIGDSWKDVF
ncbi:MAG: hypothetical protein ACTSQE_14745 [Candidatus Heimdallarchaeaceae archaeon]